MFKKYWKMYFIIFALLFIPISASAVPLGSVTIDWKSGDYGSNSSVIFYTSLSSSNLGYNTPGTGGWFPAPTFDPFFIRNITSNDIGSTFAVNGNNYAYWDNMVHYVLN